ncbi:GNAT family N-acetyltransferase [Sanyastnella coralliicola]|uniref:GNAT family N-acetyltransferase n=1 Tax=Sanyastnella coralliicola TaxID=3069118 RepID=UPI0027B9AE47|nr:GNAT family N-acetyltransferase [Longitalea sp. SCSIO 12813]
MNTRIPRIQSKRILLREITQKDLGNILLGLSNPEVTNFYGIHLDDEKAAKEQLEWFEKKEQRWWAICSPDNSEFYGAGGLNDIDLEAMKAEIGLWLLPAYWGQGIMQEALPLITEFGFRSLHLQRIEGFVESENQKCKNAMSKLDFQLENTIEEYEVKDGKAISVDVYALTVDG